MSLQSYWKKSISDTAIEKPRCVFISNDFFVNVLTGLQRILVVIKFQECGMHGLSGIFCICICTVDALLMSQVYTALVYHVRISSPCTKWKLVCI
jgi:hypothetical protein